MSSTFIVVKSAAPPPVRISLYNGAVPWYTKKYKKKFNRIWYFCKYFAIRKGRWQGKAQKGTMKRRMEACF